MPLGKDIGFLKGTLEEKMNPWMRPIYDNLEIAMMMNKGIAGCKTVEDLQKQGMLEVEPLTFIRGRSIPRQYMLLDECQNLNPLEIKTIISRCGEGTKILATGDCQQIDNPYLNKYNNGLTHVINKLKNEDCVAHITLEKGERSHLANLAAERL